jgi:hypothetical protein
VPDTSESSSIEPSSVDLSATEPAPVEPPSGQPPSGEPAPGEPATREPASPSRHRVRRTFTWILVVLTAFLVGTAAVAVWATRTVYNEDRFRSTVRDVVSDPEVISAASVYITNQAETALESSGVLDNLPAGLQPLVNVLKGALRNRVEEGVDKVLSSDAGQKALVTAAVIGHRRAVKILEGDGLLSSDALTLRNGTVTLNLVPVVRQVLIQLQQNGLIPSSITIPTDADTPGPLANALGERLPDDFGQVVIYRTDAASGDQVLKDAQRYLALTKRAVVLLVILALVAFAATIVVAVDRRRAVFRLGAAILIAAVVLIIVARRASFALAKVPATPGGRAIADAMASSLRSSLVRALVIVGIVAAVMAIVARFGGQLQAWAVTHPDLGTIAAVGLGLLILLVLGISWGSVIFAVVVAAAGVFAVRRGSWPFASRTPPA